MTLNLLLFDERALAYDRMARALIHLGGHLGHLPEPCQACAAMNLSPSHFKLEFTRWVDGRQPETVPGALAHGGSRDLLARGGERTMPPFETGLSGPGRLHDPSSLTKPHPR